VKPATPFRPREAKRFTAISNLDWELLHRVEKDFRTVLEFLPLPEPIPPLRFAPELTRDWPPALHLRDFCVMQIGTRQDFNSWHGEGWAELGTWLLGRFQNIVITGGSNPGEIKLAEKLQTQLGPRALCTRGEANWAQVAGMLYRAKLYVGLNTATMHLAAACGCPAVVLFGTTSEVHWAPWRASHRTVSAGDDSPTDPRKLLARMKGRTMAGIAAAKVIAACDDLLKDSPLPRAQPRH
jgi:heptosyltransferase-3